MLLSWQKLPASFLPPAKVWAGNAGPGLSASWQYSLKRSSCGSDVLLTCHADAGLATPGLALSAVASAVAPAVALGVALSVAAAGCGASAWLATGVGVEGVGGVAEVWGVVLSHQGQGASRSPTLVQG